MIGDEVISSTGNHDFWILDEKLVAVKDLELGNWVIFDDPSTENILESKQVLNISAKADGRFELQLDDEIITVTDSEEFWIKNEKWVQAKDLAEGDLLQTEDGDFVTVDGIEVREGTYEVYNFEVEDFHTYFVSQDGVLVHNTSCDIGTISQRISDRSYDIQGLNRTFNIKEEFVPDLVSAIEKANPGSVKQVGVEIMGNVAAGQKRILTEVDIVTDNAIFQVKTGNTKGLLRQLNDTVANTGNKNVIAIVDTTKGKGKVTSLKNVRKAGFKVIEIDRNNPDYSQILNSI